MNYIDNGFVNQALNHALASYSNYYNKAHRVFGQQIYNILRGKLGEIVVSEVLNILGVHCSSANISMTTQPDSGDLFLGNNQIVSVKTIQPFHKLLLNEISHYDAQGFYIASGSKIKFDYHVCVTISSTLRDGVLSYYKEYNNEAVEAIKYLVLSNKWEFDILGFITHEDFMNQCIIPGKVLSAGEKPGIYADTYFLEIDKLKPITDLPSFIL